MNSKYTTVCNTPIQTSVASNPPPPNPSYTSPPLTAAVTSAIIPAEARR